MTIGANASIEITTIDICEKYGTSEQRIDFNNVVRILDKNPVSHNNIEIKKDFQH